MPLTTIAAAKELTGDSTYQPLLLAEFLFPDGTYLRCASENLDSTIGGVQWNGSDWSPRLLNQTLEAMSSQSSNGIIQSPSITLALADGDRAIWTNYELADGRGFKGAKVKLYFVYWEAGTSNFSSDSRVIFVGICNPAVADATTVTVSVDNLLNMSRKTLPTVRVQNSCNWVFPTTYEQRLAGATDPDSIYFNCGYSPDVADAEARGNYKSGGTPFTSCGCTYTDCVARMGNAALPTSAAPGQLMQIEVDTSGRGTARFSGIYWNGPLDWRGRDYLTGNDKDQGINNPNDAKFNDYYPLIYGQAMVEPIVMNVVGDANSTRFEVALCAGEMPGTPADGSQTGAVQAVLVNDLLIPFQSQTGDLINRWYWGTTGRRSGKTMKGPIYNGAGNCYGGIATLLIIVPKSVQAASGIPRVRVLMAGPAVKIFDTTAVFFKDFTRTPAWHLLDMLQRANWPLDQINIQSFIDEAAYCNALIPYQAIDGTSKTHERFRSGLAYRTPRTVPECLQYFLASFRGTLYQSTIDGKLNLRLRKTLADQQPAPIPSSNSQTPVSSIKADGTAASGYVAYAFDASNIRMERDGDGWRPSLRFSQRRYADTSNRATATFQDEEANYATDNLSLVDTDDVARLGGQQIKGNLQAEGFLNYDQAFRLLESMEAEQFRGNPRAPITGTFDTGGTIEATLTTTAKVIDLRCGEICSLDFPRFGVNNWLMRVTDIRLSADAEEAEVRLTYHKDEWYRDDYGQNATAYSAKPASAFSARPPFAWCPDEENPQATDTFWKITDYQFSISQNYVTASDGSVKSALSISGKTPVNLFSATAGMPQCTGLSATGGGGTVPAGTYWVAVCATDGVGGRSAPSQTFPSATLTGAGKLTLSNFVWAQGTSGFEVYAGTNPNKLAFQLSGSGTPASIDVTSFIIADQGCPDNLFHHFSVDVSRVWHAGVCTCTLTGAGGSSLTVANANWVGGQWVGRTASIIGRKVAGTTVPVANFLITGNTADTLTVNGDVSSIVAGDTVVIRAIGGAATSTTLTDSSWVNPVPIPGTPINVVSIIGTTNALVTTQLPHACATGDQVQLTNCASASDLPTLTPGKWTVTVTGPTTLTLDGSSLDPLRNYLSGGLLQRLTFGLVPNAEVGRRATILSGTGAGQALRIASNTTTSVTLDSPWDILPDATSVWVIADDGPWTTVATNAISNADPMAPVTLAIPLPSNPNTAVLAKVYTATSSDARSLISDSPWREIYIPLPNGLGLALGTPATIPPGKQPVQWVPDPTHPGTVSGLVDTVLLEVNEVPNALQNILDLNDDVPAPVTGRTNVHFQSDPIATGKVSAYMPGATDTAEGAIKLAQDLGGTSALPKVTGLQGVPVASTTPTDGQLLTYIAADNEWEPVAPAASPYHVIFYLPGELASAAGEPTMQWTCPSDLTDGVSFASAFGGHARGYLQANPTSTATCNIYKVAAGSSAGTLGTLIGSIVIATSGTFTFSLSAGTFMPGDSMTVWPPNPIDDTLMGVGWTLPGTRGGGSGGTGGTGGGTGTTSTTHAEALTDGAGNLIFANGDLVYATGIPN